MRPEITQVYRRRSSDDSRAPPAPSTAPRTSTTLPNSGNTAPLPPDNDLDITKYKSNYRTLRSDISHPDSNECSTSHHISNVISGESLSPKFRAFTTSLLSADTPNHWKEAMQD